jgi:Tfp pilus assembly protein PilV
MTDHELTTVASAVGGSACPQADDTPVPAIGLRTTRSTIGTLRTTRCTMGALGTPMDRKQAAHATAKQTRGFTLAELLVSVGVLVLLVLLVSYLLKSAATVTVLGHKRMDADSQARQLLDRMAIDFAQMIKRSDVTYYLKGGTGGSQAGNDQIAFHSATPGYYSTTTSTSQSPVSLIAYRVNPNSSNSAYNKLERVGKGLLWNGVSPTDAPLIFWQAIAAPTDTDYSASGEMIGPGIFRFEYCYLRTDGTLSTTPPSIDALCAIVVDIAVIDPKSKVLLSDAQIVTFATPGNANFLADYSSGMTPGQLRTQWQNTVDAITSLAGPALSGIRFYERYFYLSPPVLLTP